MTSNPADSTPVATNEKIQQIPAQITTAETPAATEARDALLTAIGAEARNLEKYPGQASAQLKELTRAFRGITITSPAITAYWKGSEKTATVTVATQADADGQEPGQVTAPPESPAVAEARNQILAAIGAEAQNVAERFPGRASARSPRSEIQSCCRAGSSCRFLPRLTRSVRRATKCRSGFPEANFRAPR
ncbi:hypothetical protein [Streptomyces sp. NPDC001436]